MSSIISGMFSNYIDFFYALGYFGEYISFFITCGVIFNKHVYFFVYIIMFVLNKVINQMLKKLFKGSRPTNAKKFLYSDNFSKTKYGMPSGHSQLTFFSIVYTYLVTNKFIPWTLLLLIIGLIVMYERFIFRNHTVLQLITGAALGSFMAYFSYFLVNTVMQSIN